MRTSWGPSSLARKDREFRASITLCLDYFYPAREPP